MEVRFVHGGGKFKCEAERAGEAPCTPGPTPRRLRVADFVAVKFGNRLFELPFFVEHKCGTLGFRAATA